MCEHISDPRIFQTSLAGKQIFKDECTLCFACSSSDHGIDLCLTCFNGSCSEYKEPNKFSHTDLHTDSFQHPVYLNIRKHIKVIKPDSSQITKLAIGVEGGASIDLEEVTFNYALLCKTCSILLPIIPHEFAPLIKSIEEHKTAYESVELASWELDLKPCSHSRLLSENKQPVSVKVNLSKCTDCDLSANLWLCLICGNLGCGRKNFDGTGGNGHGIAHFQKSKHPISLKTGTISGFEQPSVYCYTCDEDIAVPNISKILNSFGIDSRKMSKTEKTMNELSLEYNLNLKLSKTFEQNLNLEELLPGNHPNGLINIGNSCYLNALIQCLASTAEFHDKFSYASDPVSFHVLTHNQDSTSHSNCLTCQLAKLATWLTLTEHTRIRPYMFRFLVGKNHVEFQTKKQQDSAEYLIHFFKKLQTVEKDLNVHFTPLFEFQSVSQITCQICGCFSLKKFKGNILDIKLPDELASKIAGSDDQETLADLSVLLASGLQLDPETLNCPTCKKTTSFNSQMYLTHFPTYLIIKLQNFVVEKFNAKKLNVNFSFDNNLVALNGLNWQTKNSRIDQSKKLDIDASAQINQGALDNLMAMGFSKNKCIKALNESNNNLENAVNLLFSMDSNDQPENNNPNKIVCSNQDYEFEKVWGLVSEFGLEKNYVQKVARHFQNESADVVVNYLMEHFTDDGSIPDAALVDVPAQVDLPGNSNEQTDYQPFGAVVHLGKSVNVGHYVAYARRTFNGADEWLYFNDEAVFKTKKPALGKAYMLFLRKIDK